MTEAGRSAKGPRGSGRVRTAVVWDVLREALDRIAKASGRAALDVIDAGGGTGGFAVPLAELGHRVTVVDASPDALAALERRAAERGVTVRALQGDADALLGAVGEDAADLVLCHSVLEYVDDPAAAMASLATAVRSGGSVSVLAGGQLAAVLHRAIAGHFDEARRLLTEARPAESVEHLEPRLATPGHPTPRPFSSEPSAPRRFTAERLADLASAAGLVPGEVHGVRVFADLVPSGPIDSDPAAAAALIALESAAATHPVLRALATQLHLLANKPANEPADKPADEPTSEPADEPAGRPADGAGSR